MSVISSLGSATGLPWKIGTIGLSVALLGAGIALTVSKMEFRSLEAKFAKLHDSVYNPKTGLLIQLTQSQTNAETLKGRIRTQNEEIDALSSESVSRMASGTAVASVHKTSGEAKQRLTIILAPPIKATGLEARVLEVDKRVMESLK
jgi:hypothetical protein